MTTQLRVSEGNAYRRLYGFDFALKPAYVSAKTLKTHFPDLSRRK